MEFDYINFRFFFYGLNYKMSAGLFAHIKIKNKSSLEYLDMLDNIKKRRQMLQKQLKE